jgi:hypothetical protein
MRPVAYVSVGVFALLALTQMLRLIMQSEVILDGVSVPAWASIPGFVVYAGLAVLLFRETRR